MECHTTSENPHARRRHRRRKRAGAGGAAYERIALIGNPNVGKSVIFGLLTGKYTTVSNYPGTTVEVSYANVSINGRRVLLVDTPGVNNMLPMSEDERVTRDILLRDRPTKVIQVGDSKNLKRTLSITIQLAEMGLPVVLDLNMEDEARDRGISIDVKKLRELLGIEVVSTVAPERKGIRELRSAISAENKDVPNLSVQYPPLLEEYVQKVAGVLPEAPISKRSVALMILSGDETLREWLTGKLSDSDVERIDTWRAECKRKHHQPVGAMVSEVRMHAAEEIAEAVMQRAKEVKSSVSAFLGRVSMHPLWGIPILLMVLYGMYWFVGVLGADILVGLVEEKLFAGLLNPLLARAVEAVIPVGFVQDLLVGEYGVITMALTYAIGIILPITTTFFVAFSILEDSGYLPRLAIMSNRMFNLMGLSGKAVLPMVLGLGCGTMAVMTTRMLETWRERVIATFLLALAVPCAAQLGVLMGIIGSLSVKALAVWVITMVGILILFGYLASKVVGGERSDFVMEIPPMRTPNLSNVMVKTFNRAVWYLKEAVPLFVYGTLVLFLLDKLGFLHGIERFLSPVVVGILGLPEETTQAFLIGFFRRDYGAAGLYAMSQQGMLNPIQTMVSLVTLTLFVPCLAHFFMMIKERGIFGWLWPCS